MSVSGDFIMPTNSLGLTHGNTLGTTRFPDNLSEMTDCAEESGDGASASNGTSGAGNCSGFDDMYGNFTHEQYHSPFDILHVKVIFIILYGIVFLMCFVGNLLVIIVVLKHRKMRTITNFFLANLAVADLCVGTFCVWPNLAVNLNPVWMLGEVMCKLVYFIQAMSYTASVNILTIISVERFFAIIYPLRSKQLATMCLLRLAVILVWIIAGGAGIPYLIVYRIQTIPNIHPKMSFCLPGDFNHRAYITANFFLGYVIPLCLITVMYSCISAVLWRTSQKNDSMKAGGYSGASESTRSKPNQNRFKKNTNGIHIKGDGNQETIEMNEKRHLSSNDSGSGADEHQNLVDSANRRSIATRLLKRMDSTLSEDIDTNEEETETEVDYEDDWPGARDGTQRSFLSDLKSSFKLKRKPKLNGIKEKKPFTTEGVRRVPPVRPVTHVYTKRCPIKVQGKQENAILARRRVIRLLLAVVISFAICVLPYHIRMLWTAWMQPEHSFWIQLTNPITFVIYYLNSGLNPVFYAFLSDRFRQCFIDVVCGRDYRVKNQMSISNRTVHSVA